MAELHEGGDPQEFQELNGQKLEELKKQKDTQRSDTYVQEISSIPGLLGVLLFIFVCSSVIGPEIKRTQGIVKEHKGNSIVVQNLKDTSLYNVLKYDDEMMVDKKQAFPHVANGDTLTYIRPNTDTVSFNVVRKINRKSLVEFTKIREQILESAKIRNSLNQKIK